MRAHAGHRQNLLHPLTFNESGAVVPPSEEVARNCGWPGDLLQYPR